MAIFVSPNFELDCPGNVTLWKLWLWFLLETDIKVIWQRLHRVCFPLPFSLGDWDPHLTSSLGPQVSLLQTGPQFV